MLHDGVVEGRRTVANVMKYVMMATSSNFGNMLLGRVAPSGHGLVHQRIRALISPHEPAGR